MKTFAIIIKLSRKLCNKHTNENITKRFGD